MERIDFIEFMDSRTAVIADIAGDEIRTWNDRTFFSQMIDIWGEVNRAVGYYTALKNDNDENGYNNLVKQLNLVHKLCFIVHSNPNVTDGEKIELKQAQWELYDFCLWSNEWGNDAKSVMKWFDQWLYDINYDLL